MPCPLLQSRVLEQHSAAREDELGTLSGLVLKLGGRAPLPTEQIVSQNLPILRLTQQRPHHSEIRTLTYSEQVSLFHFHACEAQN